MRYGRAHPHPLGDTMEHLVRAIDVGYGFVKYVTLVDGRKIHCNSFPSLAPPAGRKDLAEALGKKRNTVEIEADGLRFEVGPDAALAQGTFVGRNLDDDYCLTPAYLALVRGALHYMRVDSIDLLVVGLPVSTFASKRAALKARLLGSHPLPEREVLVREVLVLSQPHGALGTYGLAHRNYREVAGEVNLVIDCGSRTFDWLVAKGFHAVDQKSRAVNRGMIDVVDAIAEQLAQHLGAPFSDFEKIDRALRTGTRPTIMGKTVDLEPYLPAARKIAQDAVQELRRRVDAATDIDNIVLAGGGAFFFKPFRGGSVCLNTIRAEISGSAAV
jgi:plasmid segregation protein ParM